MTDSHDNSSRRTFLKAAGVAGVLGVIGTRGRAQGATTIELGGSTGGWIGRSPESITETRNPTLELEPGQTYEIVWENVDGARHNVVILDEEQEQLVRSEIIAEQGATQTVEFEATEAMTEYLCEVHPTTMVGDVAVGGGSADQGTQTETIQTGTTQAETTTEIDGAANETIAQNATGGNQTEVPVTGQPGTVQEGTSTVTPEVNEDALAEFQGGNATDGGTTEVPGTRNSTDVDVGEGNETETEQGSRLVPSVDRSGVGTLGALGGLTSAGAYLLTRDGDDEE